VVPGQYPENGVLPAWVKGFPLAVADLEKFMDSFQIIGEVVWVTAPLGTPVVPPV